MAIDAVQFPSKMNQVGRAMRAVCIPSTDIEKCHLPHGFGLYCCTTAVNDQQSPNIVISSSVFAQCVASPGSCKAPDQKNRLTCQSAWLLSVLSWPSTYHDYAFCALYVFPCQSRIFSQACHGLLSISCTPVCHACALTILTYACPDLSRFSPPLWSHSTYCLLHTPKCPGKLKLTFIRSSPWLGAGESLFQ